MLFALAPTANAQNQEVPGCGRLGENYAGYAMDYYTATPFDRKRVEGPHFDREHAALARGQTTVDYSSSGSKGISVAGSLDYTLRVWPNHPGALADITKYARIKKSENPDGLKSVKCYFIRAITFKPEDGTVRFLYTLYLLDFGYDQEAAEQLQTAVQLIDQPGINMLYNIGLAYLRLKRYDEARKIAEEVYTNGYELPGLRNMLQRAGKW